MLPPEVGVAGTGGSAAVGPACACTLKPLPCLVDNWVTVRSVPYEQPLSIQTDMEYTLDTRLFPGWDPVMGDGQSALIVDTAVLTARSQQAAAATPTPTAATGSRPAPIRRHPARATRYATRQQQQQAAAPSRNVAAYGHPAPADLPPSMPRSHPAFRPAAAAPLPHYQQQQQAPAAQPTTDADLLALIASIDVDPAGYTLDVDWLLAGQQHHHQQQQLHPTMTTHTHHTGTTPVQHVIPPRPLPAHIQHQVAPPAAIQQPQPQPRMRTYTTGISDYQSQFYPGASWGGMVGMPDSCRNNGCVVGSSCSSAMACNNMTGSGAVMSGYLQTQRVVQSRPMKRKLPVDSPCEGSLPVAYIDLTQISPSPTPIQMAKRGRWAGDWSRAFGLGMPHAPSPLHNRAY